MTEAEERAILLSLACKAHAASERFARQFPEHALHLRSWAEQLLAVNRSIEARGQAAARREGFSIVGGE